MHLGLVSLVVLPLFQIIRCFSFYKCIVFVMHLDIHNVYNLEWKEYSCKGFPFLLGFMFLYSWFQVVGIAWVASRCSLLSCVVRASVVVV